MGSSLSYNPEANQSGRVAVVTGGNTGIGYETAKGLALLGAHVVIACRSEERATAAIERMRAEVSQEHPDKGINVEFMALDLASLQSVKKFTNDYKQRGLPLHMLINNAAMMPAFDAGRQITEDGIEVLFQVNHLGPFYLTLELLPVMLSSAPDARIVFVSSCGHVHANPFNVEHVQADNLQLMCGKEVVKHYLDTKLYNSGEVEDVCHWLLRCEAGERDRSHLTDWGLLDGLGSVSDAAVAARVLDRTCFDHSVLRIMAADALQRRTAGKGVTVSSVGPGLVRTELGRNISGPIKWFFQVVSSIGVPRDAKTGAATSLYASVQPGLNKEEFLFYEDCKPAQSQLDATSRNVEYQEQLWETSCKLLTDFLSADVMREFGLSGSTTEQKY